MTTSEARRLICKAALLEDTEAAAFLYAQLSPLSDWTDGVMELLLAYAWLAPDAALAWHESTLFAPIEYSVRGWLEQLQEARQLGKQSAEKLTVYSTLTALLPDSPEQERRLRIQWLVRAMMEPERVLEDPDWYRQLTNPFLQARLWKWFPEQFWEALQQYPMLIRGFYPVGQLMLAGLGKEGHLPLLFKLTLDRRSYAKGVYTELEVFALLAALDTLEKHCSGQLKNAVPTLVFQAIPEPIGSYDQLLAARLLILMARVDGASEHLLCHIVARISWAGDSRVVRRWARTITRNMARFDSVPESAYQLARVVRLLALKHYLEVIATNGQASWPGDIPRVQRWLKRSERVIAWLSDNSWREYFHARRTRLLLKK